jgi:FKBP-type peptidyl-prolyl cis-trans isomerase
MKKLSIVFSVLLVTFLFSCKQEMKRTAKGYEYLIVKSNDKGTQIKPGDNVSFNIAFYVNDSLKDSRQMDQSIPSDIGKSQYPPFIELLAKMKDGDSAYVLVRLDTMKQLAPKFKKTDVVKYAVKVTGVTDAATLAKNKEDLAKSKGPILDQMKAIVDQNAKGQVANAQKTASGIQYVIMEKGTGKVHAKGETAKVHYIGMTTDGKEFDSSFSRGEAFSVPVGMGQVIPGWDELLSTLAIGTKGIAIIPAALAYGEKGAGGGAIPPNANLIFYMDIQK